MAHITSSGTGPATSRRLFVGLFPEPEEQLMVEVWLNDDGTFRAVTAARRTPAVQQVVWGPPITLEERT